MPWLLSVASHRRAGPGALLSAELALSGSNTDLRFSTSVITGYNDCDFKVTTQKPSSTGMRTPRARLPRNRAAESRIRRRNSPSPWCFFRERTPQKSLVKPVFQSCFHSHDRHDILHLGNLRLQAFTYNQESLYLYVSSSRTHSLFLYPQYDHLADHGLQTEHISSLQYLLLFMSSQSLSITPPLSCHTATRPRSAVHPAIGRTNVSGGDIAMWQPWRALAMLSAVQPQLCRRDVVILSFETTTSTMVPANILRKY